ncbi:hypothetical protein P7C70_g4018, partial [Phenoliferia sp. Uapishka_3]
MSYLRNLARTGLGLLSKSTVAAGRSSLDSLKAQVKAVIPQRLPDVSDLPNRTSGLVPPVKSGSGTRMELEQRISNQALAAEPNVSIVATTRTSEILSRVKAQTTPNPSPSIISVPTTLISNIRSRLPELPALPSLPQIPNLASFPALPGLPTLSSLPTSAFILRKLSIIPDTISNFGWSLMRPFIWFERMVLVLMGGVCVVGGLYLAQHGLQQANLLAKAWRAMESRKVVQETGEVKEGRKKM